LTVEQEGERSLQETISLLEDGWTSLPRRESARWLVPRASRGIVASSLAIYQPVTLKGLAGWKTARLLASMGGFHVLPRGGDPPPEVLAALAPYLPAGGTIAISRGVNPGRTVALLITADGRLHSVAKVATDDPMRAALAKEARALETLAPQMPKPLVAPTVLAQDDGVILLEVVDWRPRLRPWQIPEEVAQALGAFFRLGVEQESNPLGNAHGDFAPWNLFWTSRGSWALLDWEHAHADAAPFFDIFHYTVMSHALLGLPSRQTILDGLSGDGWLGRALTAYSHAADLPRGDARDCFVDYLACSAKEMNPQTRDGRLGLRARARLMSSLREQALGP
jgi:Phosphotransferase enzyme family